MKLDLKTMKDINKGSFNLHIERDAMESSHTFDIYSYRELDTYTISVVDNINKTKKIYHKNNNNYYSVESKYCDKPLVYRNCMIKKTVEGMYVLFHNITGFTIQYFNAESTEIIGDLDTDFYTLAKAQKYQLYPDGEVTIKRKFTDIFDILQLFRNIEEVYSDEIAKLELNK